MSEKVINDLEEKMNKSLKNLQGDLNKVRTGRASLALFDDIRMDYTGLQPLLIKWPPSPFRKVD